MKKYKWTEVIEAEQFTTVYEYMTMDMSMTDGEKRWGSEKQRSFQL